MYHFEFIRHPHLEPNHPLAGTVLELRHKARLKVYVRDPHLEKGELRRLSERGRLNLLGVVLGPDGTELPHEDISEEGDIDPEDFELFTDDDEFEELDDLNLH